MKEIPQDKPLGSRMGTNSMPSEKSEMRQKSALRSTEAFSLVILQSLHLVFLTSLLVPEDKALAFYLLYVPLRWL